MTDTPLVSILIPAYNCEAWVGAAIESALAQTWPNKEVIVFDDGSTDGTLAVIRSFGDAIRYDSARLGGQNVTRNRLTEMSRGEWLVYLDADDELMPDSVEKKMRHSGETEVVYGSTEVARFVGKEKVASYIEPALEYVDHWEGLFGWHYPNTSAMLLKRSAVLAAGGWDTSVKNCTDYAIYFPIAANGGRFKPVPDAISMYRHWSLSQASYENSVRRIHTRLDMMVRAVRELTAKGEATSARLDIWARESLRGLRILQQWDRGRIGEFLGYIEELHPSYRPGPPAFSRSYALMFRCFGFYPAQRVADLTRDIRRMLGLLRLEPEKYFLPGADNVKPS